MDRGGTVMGPPIGARRCCGNLATNLAKQNKGINSYEMLEK